MIAKATVITHGSNAVRYSADKNQAEIVKTNRLPEDISPSAMWSRMVALQYQFREKLNRHRPLKNTSIRIELSPAREETKDWTMADWVRLADEYIREFDAVDLSRRAKRESAKSTNLKDSQYVVSLHRDSKSGILHLHINANRIDMEGNVNDAHYINERAMAAANKITERRGWVQAEDRRKQNIEAITRDITHILFNMDSFDWNTFAGKVEAKGYGITMKRDSNDRVVGYSISKGNSRYKSSDLGHSRNLTPSRIEDTWRKMHPEDTYHEQTDKPTLRRSDTSVQERHTQQRQQPFVSPQPMVQAPSEPKPVMFHHDIEVDGRHYLVDVPEAANRVLTDEDIMPDDVLWSTLEDVQHTAILLFANYIDAAISISEDCGGGGGCCAPSSGWGKEDDEDDWKFARRCVNVARYMHTNTARPKRERSRGFHR